MKSTPANLCVIAHFIGRGACVYCRLLSVLLMQIIKFGGKLVVNPRCSSIEHHNFKRNKAVFYVLLLNRLHRREIKFCSLHPASYRSVVRKIRIIAGFLKLFIIRLVSYWAVRFTRKVV